MFIHSRKWTAGVDAMEEYVQTAEMSKKSGNGSRISKASLCWGALFGVSLLCIWLTQQAVPIMMDDEWYSTLLFEERELSSLQDIFKAQVWHYCNWGGRTVAHTLAQLILHYLSEGAADVLNTAAIVILAWIIVGFARVQEGGRLAMLTLVTGFLHALNANWKMSMYWQTGACNYLYTTLFVLGFLGMYLKVLEEPERATGNAAWKVFGKVLLSAFLGLAAGWSNENMGPAVWVVSLVVIVLVKREKRCIPLWMVSGNVFCLLGSALMIAAPGNRVRSTQVAGADYGTLWQLFLRMYGVCKGAWEYLFPTLLVMAGVLFVNVCVLGNRLGRRELLLLLGAALSWGAMILSPHYPDRAAFGTMCLLLCVIFSQSEQLLRTRATLSCRAAMAGIGVFIWLRGMYFLGEFLSISWGWIR